MRVLLALPPLTQLNTPYPSTAYLTGYLRRQGYTVEQADLGLELVLRVFSSTRLAEVARHLGPRAEQYLSTIDSVIRFLQGKDPTLAFRISGRDYLPEGPRFRSLEAFESATGAEALGWAFGALGLQDRARHLASLYLDDLTDLISENIDPRFALSRYGEKLAASAPTFDPLREALESDKPTWVDRCLDSIAEVHLSRVKPDVLGLSIPFPGNVYGAFRIARVARRVSPHTKILIGGGYVNTELRELKDPRVFDYVDYVTFDDGERPFTCVLESLCPAPSSVNPNLSPLSRAKTPLSSDLPNLLRTMVREGGRVVFKTSAALHDVPQKDVGAPSYAGLPIHDYLSVLEMLNPMHRLWSDGRWNKLTLAHGCYWKKCSFCDITLDYIGRYEPTAVEALVDRIEAVIEETRQTGFHFVDEAAPPALLKALAQRLIDRKVQISWWGNIRFEKSFTPSLARLLAQSGCVALSGGLEVASDRLLKLMNKGVTVEQVARASRALNDAGILVHAYLMYGFPTQTEQDTLDALERVRQLFSEGCLTSAYWHRFSATAHSPVGKDPQKFGVRLLPMPDVMFAKNDLDFEDPTPCDHEAMGRGLNKALYNFMHGIGLDEDVRSWFDVKVPKARVPKNFVREALSQ